MRVLILSWEYPPIVEGGLARHVHKIATQLALAGHDVHVLTRGEHHGGSGRLGAGDRAGVPVIHRVPEPERPAQLDAFIEWIARMNEDMVGRGLALVAEHGFDVIHGHDWLVASAADRLARHAAVPMVATIHATEFGRHQGWVDKHPQSHIHGIETWMARRSDRVITCSDYMRGHVAEVFGRDEQRITVIPNGIDPDDLRPAGDLAALRAQYAAPHERLVVLVGRLVYEKGFQHALEALAGPDGVIDRVGDVRFVVAGSGTHEQELHAQAAALGLDDHGRFLGWVGDDVLHALYRVADLSVVPSIYEPFGLVALEAMASGCPCIVADSGGLREVVPDSFVGMRFPSRDAQALAGSMVRLLTDEDLRQDVIARSTEHIRRFDWAEIARETAAVYDEVVAAVETTRPEPASR
ncbi:MAG: glycosyltransferase family 4 protein [Patulibacter sp.]|nr:glycosyltransferase family 4 protein [Patulibacter sp.]